MQAEMRPRRARVARPDGAGSGTSGSAGSPRPMCSMGERPQSSAQASLDQPDQGHCQELGRRSVKRYRPLRKASNSSGATRSAKPTRHATILPRSMSAYTVALETRRRAATSAGVRKTPSEGRATGAPNGVVPYASRGTVCVRPDPGTPAISAGCLAVPRGASLWKTGEGPWGASGRRFKSCRPDKGLADHR